MSIWKTRNPYEGSELDIGDDIRLSTTNQSDRGCGWVFHVSFDGINGGDTLTQRGGFATEADAIEAANEWLRRLCTTALSAIAAAKGGA